MEAANKGAIERAKKDGDIPTLVALSKDGTPDAREKAATALRNLTSDNAANREAIAAAGGIAPLVALAKDGTPVAREQAAVAL